MTDFSLVDPAEADPLAGLVSISSPLGKAVLGHVPGERVRVHAPGGVRLVTVMSATGRA